MRTDRSPLDRRDGFTLIEVLIAMVIFSMGLLVVQALSISTISTLSNADRNSRSATLATFYLEDALQQVRQNRQPHACTDKAVAGGAKVSRTVTLVPNGTAAAVTGTRVDILVTVTPPSASAPTYRVRGSSYAPIGTLAGGRACP